MSDDKLAKVKAGIKGAEIELELSKEVPGVLAGLFPTTALRSQTRRMLTGQILGKVNSRQLLDDAELEYIENVLKPAEAKFIKQKAILERAAQLLKENPPHAALPPHSATEESSSIEDWLSKFWDDAGLVSDEQLREIYARLLVAEASSRGSCSLRTLKVLRYLDPQTATLFARAIPLVFSKRWIPHNNELLAKYDLKYTDILELADSDLIQTDSVVLRVLSNDEFYSWGEHWVRFENCSNVTFPIYRLTCAGRELTRVAQVERKPDYLRATIEWLKSLPQLDKLQVSIALRQNDIDTDDALLRKLSWSPVQTTGAGKGQADTQE